MKPQTRRHRGFFYLDDDIVTNSLLALESGKIDEIVAKVNSAREGGVGGALGMAGVRAEGGKKSASGFEEEMVRKRTRFSVFELWYQGLIEAKAIGSFQGWGHDALVDVCPGDTLEVRGHLEIAPIETLFRLYLWFAGKAKEQGHVFSQKGEQLKETKEAERNIRMVLGHEDAEDDQVVLIATPNGEPGPLVAFAVKTKWLIGRFGQFGGEYSVIAQVDRILNEGEEIPALRLTRDVAATALEVDTLKKIVENFDDPSRTMGMQIDKNAATITGPALWLEPIAIYR